MYDEGFFGREFAERVQEFRREREGLGVRVEIVTLEGERLDVLDIVSGDAGVRLVTRDDRLVFLPYAHIAHVDVTLLRDHRITSFELPAA